jgi:hypothetical protein
LADLSRPPAQPVKKHKAFLFTATRLGRTIFVGFSVHSTTHRKR